MANTILTGMCDSFKAECVSGAHCFVAPQTLTFTSTATTIISGLTSVANLAVGMVVSGTNIVAGTTLSRILSQTSVQIDVAPSAAITTATFTGDTFKGLLISPTGSNSAYGRGTYNVGTPGTGTGTGTGNVGTDETSGTGYTAGGVAMTNITPLVSAGNGAYWAFSNNPTWTSATFSTIGMIIYNTTPRFGYSAGGIAATAGGSAVNRAVSTHTFIGTQTVVAGTFTVTFPPFAWGSALFLLQ